MHMTLSVQLSGLLCVHPRVCHIFSNLINVAKYLINALVERDAEKLNRVGVIRLASQGFTRATPPFVEFEADLRERTV